MSSVIVNNGNGAVFYTRINSLFKHRFDLCRQSIGRYVIVARSNADKHISYASAYYKGFKATAFYRFDNTVNTLRYFLHFFTCFCNKMVYFFNNIC